MGDAVSHELEMRFALMTDGTSIGVNVAPAIVEAFFVFATKAITGAHCIPSLFVQRTGRIQLLTPCSRLPICCQPQFITQVCRYQ